MNILPRRTCSLTLEFFFCLDSLNLKVVGNEPIVKNSEEEISTDIPKKKPDFSKVPQSSSKRFLFSFMS